MSTQSHSNWLAVARWVPRASAGCARPLGSRRCALPNFSRSRPCRVSRWENSRKPLERRAVALVSALALEQVEGKAAARAVLEALAARKKVPRTVRLDVNAAS